MKSDVELTRKLIQKVWGFATPFFILFFHHHFYEVFLGASCRDVAKINLLLDLPSLPGILAREGAGAVEPEDVGPLAAF